MRVCSGGGCERHYSAGRGLLIRAPQLQASDSSLEAQRAQLECAIAMTTILIFVFSVLYIVVSTIFCLCTDTSQQEPGSSEMVSQQSAAVVEETKRALEEIPVVVVQMRRDPGSGSGGASAEDDKESGECAVCMVEYAGGEEVRVLPSCRHDFHRECVDGWLLTRAPTCPVCRAPVVVHAKGPDTKV